ncbi:globin domain-containing protein [Streptomyces sp. NPDC001922]|uniref:globin domain-containing protein n=1 Tax=Streptomyces sp. NPDC001922 TaxID=3364624 RepID=UPI0036C38593
MSPIRPVGGRGQDRGPAEQHDDAPRPGPAAPPNAFGGAPEHQRPADHGPGQGVRPGTGPQPAAPGYGTPERPAPDHTDGYAAPGYRAPGEPGTAPGTAPQGRPYADDRGAPPAGPAAGYGEPAPAEEEQLVPSFMRRTGQGLVATDPHRPEEHYPDERYAEEQRPEEQRAAAPRPGGAAAAGRPQPQQAAAQQTAPQQTFPQRTAPQPPRGTPPQPHADRPQPPYAAAPSAPSTPQAPASQAPAPQAPAGTAPSPAAPPRQQPQHPAHPASSQPPAGPAGGTSSAAPAAPAAAGTAGSAGATRPASTAAPANTAGPAAEAHPEDRPRPAAEAGTASPDAILIQRTMAEIEPIADKVTSYFYAMLFVQHPDLRALFPASMDTQRDRLFKALLTAARHVDDSATLSEYLSHLGRGHRKYGTQPEHYPAVGEALLGALARHAPESWSAETQAAWVRAYTAISQIMIDAAAENERTAPAWWDAEVVAHDLRTPDIAVVTVRPDQPYPFRAGQYTSLETPWWPRVWRHYSFSSAPRSDGLLSFHVKAVPAGWVSNALVHRARPGDTIRLGPPAGSMTVDHSTDNGLLCLGGGTGIAPIKALVEDVAEHGRTRPVEVFYGARSDHDLYDIDTLLRLEKSHSWLAVRPVVSHGPTNGLSGPLPDAVRQYGPWNAYDAYLSGPPGMIRSGIDALTGIGIPSHRIRHDSLEELVAAGA